MLGYNLLFLLLFCFFDDLDIYHQGGSPGLNHIQSSVANLGLNITTNGGNITLQHGTSSKEFIVCDGVTDKNVEIYCNGTKRIETTQSGVIISGIATATTFSGSGASLTNLSAANLTGTLPAISGANLTNLPSDTPADTDVQITFDISASGSSGYIFTGPGNDGSTVNPDIYLVRGQRYIFDVNASGHPFQLRVANGGAAYSDGVTNNGAQSGQVIFNVQHDAPAALKYLKAAYLIPASLLNHLKFSSIMILV